MGFDKGYQLMNYVGVSNDVLATDVRFLEFKMGYDQGFQFVYNEDVFYPFFAIFFEFLRVLTIFAIWLIQLYITEFWFMYHAFDF